MTKIENRPKLKKPIKSIVFASLFDHVPTYDTYIMTPELNLDVSVREAEREKPRVNKHSERSNRNGTFHDEGEREHARFGFPLQKLTPLKNIQKKTKFSHYE